MWRPQPGPQLHLIEADWCPEIFFGGARGGGKSDALLGDYLQDVNRYRDYWKGIFFRKTYNELEPAIERAKQIFQPAGAEWWATSKTFKFPSGAFIRFRHLETLDDAAKYQGHDYTWIGIDEAGNWDDERKVNYLRATLRSAGDVPTKRMRLSGNPGGVGAVWIKPRYIDPYPAGYMPIADPLSKEERMFIPSRVTDNKELLRNDPHYIARLKQLGSPQLIRMWLLGDWNAELGQYFDGIDDIIVKPFEIPETWSIIRGFDWGYSKPFCVLWAAIADGTQPFNCKQHIPRGSIVVYREWYGSTAPNQGLRLDPQQIVEGVLQRESEREKEKILYSIADPACFDVSRGPSIAEMLARHGFSTRPGDNKRISGWQQIRYRIKGADSFPMVYIFDTSANLLRTLRGLKHDDSKSEDVDTSMEDHAPDTLRYICMSRPWTPPAPKQEKDWLREPTIKELLEDFDRRMEWG